MAIDIGRIAYQAYVDNLLCMQGFPLPWEELNKFNQDAWRKIGVAVLQGDDFNKSITFEEVVKEKPQVNYPFLKLQVGSNLVRFLTKPYQYKAHNFIVNGKPSYGQKLQCPNYDGADPCPLCKEGHSSKSRWMIGVLARSTNCIYILDINTDIFCQVQNLSRELVWGNPETYDMNINFSYDYESNKEKHVVVPYPKSELTSNEIDVKKSIDLNYLAELCKFPVSLISIVENKEYKSVFNCRER